MTQTIRIEIANGDISAFEVMEGKGIAGAPNLIFLRIIDSDADEGQSLITATMTPAERDALVAALKP